MEVVIGFTLGAVFFMQGCEYFGLSQPKTTGVVGVIGAIVLASLAIWKPLAALANVPMEALAATSVLLAIYAALVAAVGLWDSDSRGLGLYSAFAGVIALVGAIYMLVTGTVLLPVLCQAITAVAFGMVFFYVGLPSKGLRVATAWVLVIAGAADVVLHFFAIMRAPGLV